MADAYPLEWPHGWPRTESPQRSRFDTSFAQARDGVIDELNRMGVPDYHVVISTNIQTRRDGLPYANMREPDDKGVAVYFTLHSRQQCIPCDRWDRVKDNLQAIRKTIDALRGLERWGADSMVNAAFRGFAALPDPASTGGEHWADVLQISSDAPWPDVRDAYQRARRFAHPDAGGSNEAFNRIQAAWEQAKQERGL